MKKLDPTRIVHRCVEIYHDERALPLATSHDAISLLMAMAELGEGATPWLADAVKISRTRIILNKLNCFVTYTTNAKELTSAAIRR